MVVVKAAWQAIPRVGIPHAWACALTDRRRQLLGRQKEEAELSCGRVYVRAMRKPEDDEASMDAPVPQLQIQRMPTLMPPWIARSNLAGAWVCCRDADL
jgi:hypothetical protein